MFRAARRAKRVAASTVLQEDQIRRTYTRRATYNRRSGPTSASTRKVSMIAFPARSAATTASDLTANRARHAPHPFTGGSLGKDDDTFTSRTETQLVVQKPSREGL